MEKTSIGLSENVAGLLCYILGWMSGVVFILIEHEDKFVRFHAVQSMVTFGSITIVVIALYVLGFIPFLGFVFAIANWVIAALTFVLWIVLIVTAIQGTEYKLPWAGRFAEKYA